MWDGWSTAAVDWICQLDTLGGPERIKVNYPGEQPSIPSVLEGCDSLTWTLIIVESLDYSPFGSVAIE